MVKTCLKAVFLGFLVFAFSFTVNAASSVLTKIGAMDVTAGYSEWWYTQENPTLSGVAAANAQVSIKIDDTTNTVTADSSGNWSYSPTTLTQGDHNIVISSGSDSYSFVLHAGQSMPSDTGSDATESTASGTVPETGSSQMLWIIAGLALVSAGYSFSTRKVALKSFENDITRE